MGLSDSKVGPVAAVSDLPRARKFYEDRLGLTAGEELPGGAGFSYPCADGTGLTIYLSPEHAGKSTATLFGWQVADVEQLVDELSAKGVSFEQYDQAELKTDERGIVAMEGMKVAFFRDPDGNTHAINGS